jgi:class 3 adenylate cyclase/predicted ATPase
MRDVRDWLDGLGLGKYAAVFEENDVDLDVVPMLTDEELRDLGLPLGARKKIIQAAKNLPLQQAAPPLAASPAKEVGAIGPERRQITVMFSDIVGSTALAEQLDAEDLRAVLMAYQQSSAEAVETHHGHVAQYLGDGILAYFGYPHAYEDAAAEAIRAALSIVDRMQHINERLLAQHGVALQIRVGLHTGLVVAGEMGAGRTRESLAVGETPNIAARIQSLAEPGSVVASETTWRLVEGLFTSTALGLQTLKGLSHPISLYKVEASTGVAGRFEARAAGALSPLVSREAELTLLRKRWDLAQAGEGQVLLVQGEAGIGKSRLVYAFRELLPEDSVQSFLLHCSPHHQTSAFYPVVELLGRVLNFRQEDTTTAKRDKLQAHLHRLGLSADRFGTPLSLLLSIAEEDGAGVDPDRTRRLIFEAFIQTLLGMAPRRSLLLITEDVHWIDASTQELLGHLAEAIAERPAMLLLTARPEYRTPWSGLSHMNTLTLGRLSRRETETLIRQVAGPELTPEVFRQLVSRSDGIPLFVEELTKSVIESTHSASGLAEAVPATLQEALTARLDRLSPVKEIAQLGAVLGREFSYALLRAVTTVSEPALQQGLALLVDAQLLYQKDIPPQATYSFKHALVQDVAYQSLLRDTRQQYHRRVAQILETQFRETVDSRPELLARHYTEAGAHEDALVYWQNAGRRAVERSAHIEAISHFSRGLEALRVSPESHQKIQAELDLNIALGPSLIATKGWAAPEVERVYARARELCLHLGDVPQLFRTLWGLWAFRIVRGNVVASRELAEQLLELANHSQDQNSLVDAHHALGQTLSAMGHFDTARTHLERSAALYQSLQHHLNNLTAGPDIGVFSSAYLSHTLWHLGLADQAVTKVNEAIALARELSHPFSEVLALDYAAMLHQFRGEPELAHGRAEAARVMCEEQGFEYYRVWALIIQGWVLTARGRADKGLDEIQGGVTAIRATGAAYRLPYYLALLAGAHAKSGQPASGLTLLTEAFDQMRKAGEFWMEAELYRLRGELLLTVSADHHDEAAQCFHQALNVARRQQALLVELRAATSLSRLLNDLGQRSEAGRLLADVYGRLTEGLNTFDARAAQMLLGDLEGGN